MSEDLKPEDFRIFDYTPRLRQDLEKDGDGLGEPVFEGKIKIRVLSGEKRLAYAKAMRLKISGNGDVELDEGIDVMNDFLKIAKQNILEVDLSVDGHEIKNVNDLEFYEEGIQLLKEVGQVMVGGLKLGKPRSKK